MMDSPAGKGARCQGARRGPRRRLIKQPHPSRGWGPDTLNWVELERGTPSGHTQLLAAGHASVAGAFSHQAAGGGSAEAGRPRDL